MAGCVGCGLGVTAQLVTRLAQREDRQDSENKPRDPGDQEGASPAVMLRHDPADGHPKKRSDGYARGVDGQRCGALVGWEIIGEQRVGGWRTTGLADTYAGACER